MPAKLRFQLQSLILHTLIPSLLLVTVVVGALVFRNLQAAVLEGFDRKLSAISSVTGAFIDGDEHARILQGKNEKDPLYLKYVGPMQRIRQRNNLTFIYTQVLGKGANIVYVLDGQIGEGHSAIGDEDTLPNGEVRGARNVIHLGRVHLSAIRAWEQWGLLKSGFAPIYDGRGRAVAMAGADVDISTIRDKTSVALAQVGVTSILALLIAGFLSIAIARSLTQPIAEVKEAALQVAAGQYGHRIHVQRPWELVELAASFSAMSETLAATMRERKAVQEDLERRRRLSQLRRLLREPVCRPPTGQSPEAGAVTTDDRSWSLFWESRADADPLDAARGHAELAGIGKRLLEYYRENPESLTARLQHLFGETVSCFVLLDHRSGTVRTISRQAAPALVAGGTKPAREPELLTER